MFWRVARRRLITIVAVLLAIELAYIVAANGFLRSDWGCGLLNRRPQKLAIGWGSAWTWIPGIVTFRHLEMEGRARRAIWATRIESGWMVIWLPSLTRKHFYLLRGAGEGTVVEVDIRPAPKEAEGRRRRKRGWRVTLEDLDIEPVDVLRVNEHRLSGAGRIRGEARFQVRGPMELDLTEVSYAGARLDTGEETAADSVRLDGTIHIAPFVVGDDAVGDILAGTTGKLAVDAQASGLGFLAAYLGGVPWLKLGGQGQLTVDLEVTDGWLAPGSRIDLAGPTVTATYFDLEARGEGTLRGIVPESAGHTELNVELDRFAVVRPRDEARLLDGENLEMRITNDSTAIDRPAEGIALEVDLPESEIPDFSAFSEYLPEASGLELIGGRGAVAANLRYSAVERSGSGSLHLSGERVEAAFGEVRINSEVRLEVNLGELRLDDGVFDIAGSRLSIEDTETQKDDRIRDQGWWGRMQLSEGTWTRRPGEADPRPGVLEGLASAQLRDTGPLVALLERHVRRLAWFDGLLTVHDVAATARVRSQGASLRFDGLEMTGGEKQRLEVLAELELEEKSPNGVLFARWGPLAAAVALEEGKRDWKLTRSRSWYEEQARSRRRNAAGGTPEEARRASGRE